MASDQGFDGVAKPGMQARTGTVGLPAAEHERHRPVTVVQPSRGWIALRLGDLWAYRELGYLLAWRDVKVRYAQTLLGALWAVIQPLTMMVIFALVFGRFAKLPSEGVPYTLFALAALVPWTFFASGLSGAAQSLVRNEQLVSKIYFPRLLLPIGAAGSFLLDLAIGTVLLFVLMPFYGFYPGIRTLTLPAIALLPLACALAVGILFAALSVRYRDVAYVVPFLIQIWLFATPVAYSATLLPDELQSVIGLNPMAGAVEGFRWAVLETGSFPSNTLLLSGASCVVLLLVALIYFRRTERHFADLI
jgi:homopolymeric O-antigen transport system permease protein